uniref:Uncharacterized protein n=1 Tax=Glossina morsitans morsitans TaxID=37546 RepID=A0A1B0FAN4_GLOMM
MSIAKLFVKVFNENIFEDRAESVSSKEHGPAAISSVQTGKSCLKQSLPLSEVPKACNNESLQEANMIRGSAECTLKKSAIILRTHSESLTSN